MGEEVEADGWVRPTLEPDQRPYDWAVDRAVVTATPAMPVDGRPLRTHGASPVVLGRPGPSRRPRPLRRRSAASSCPRRSSPRSRSSSASSAPRGRPTSSAPSSPRCSRATRAGRRRSPSATASRSASGCGCCSSARTSRTPARTRSTTCSARRCSRDAWASSASSPRPARASTASPPPRRARCSGSTARCSWARSTSSARRSTCGACSCSAPRWCRSSRAAATLKDAINDALRDWVASVETTHYCIGSVVGPHPYPWIVREFQRVVGDEAREQCRVDPRGADPDVVVACVGGGSNAIGTFAGFLDTDARLIGVEAGGHGLESGQARRVGEPRRARRPARRAVAVPPGRGRPDPRGALDQRRSRLPGRRPGARGARGHRAGRVRLGQRRRRARRLRAARGDRGHRARARARARDRLARARGRPRRAAGLDGAGHAVGPRRQGRRPGRRDPRDRGLPS